MKKSRKKILLSSIAMLLVALVALGSATFAWFTINKEVTADTMKVQAITTAGLVINNTNSTTYSRAVHFDSTAFDLQPASYVVAADSTFPTNGVYAKDVSAEGVGNASGWTTCAVSDAAVDTTANALRDGNSNYLAVYDVRIKSSDDTAIAKPVTANITFTDDSEAGKASAGFVKAALVDASNNTVKCFWTDGTAYTPKTTTGADSTEITTATDSAQVLSTVAANTVYEYKLYVWYEGNDEQCVNANQGAVANFTIKFTLGD